MVCFSKSKTNTKYHIYSPSLIVYFFYFTKARDNHNNINDKCEVKYKVKSNHVENKIMKKGYCAIAW